jgi:hypothetical protein
MHPGSLSLDAFLALRATDRRLARLTHDLGLPEGRGLEFGPSDNPTPLPDGLRVAYVDHAIDAQASRPGAVAIDHVWSGSGPLGTVLGGTRIDFVIAAQVAQYVPNLLGWFRGIYAALRPGGVLNLSLPDKRFMFDALRAESTMAELIEADLLAYTRPSPRQLFAHTYEARALETGQIWAGENPAEKPRLCGDAALAHAHAEAVRALEAGRYVDCHCWVFTPSSLLDRIACATQLGLFPFVLNQLGGTDPGGFEFYVSMRRDREEEPQALRALQEGAIAHLSGIQERQRRMAALIAST